MNTVNYKISFTTGGLYYREAIKVAEIYYPLRDWELVKAEILTNNILKSRTQSSLIRTTRELIQRLRGLSDEQLLVLIDGTRQEQNQILWFAVCRQYQFIREFAVEVIREKFLRFDLNVSYRDFDAFFNAKAEWNDCLDKTTDSTRKKLRQVLFRMMMEAEIISPSSVILPMIMSPRVAQAIGDVNIEYFSIFPMSEGNVRK